MTTISVAMATYNGGQFLAEQLDSLVRQTVLPTEIVVCDDQSTDATPEIVKAFSRKAPVPVRFYTNPSRLRFADNFLKAASLCEGTYIAFCDQDDIWAEDKLAQISAVISARPSVALISHRCSVFGDVVRPDGFPRIARETGTVSSSRLSPWQFFPGFTCTFKADVLDLFPANQRPIDILTPEYKLAHDRWIALLAPLVGPAFVLDSQLVGYRQHEANESAAMRSSNQLREKLRGARTKYGTYLAKNRKVALECVEVLDRIDVESEGDKGNSVDRELLVQKRAELVAVAKFYESRLTAAEEDSRVQRLKRVFSSAIAGLYRTDPNWESQIRLILVDVAGCFIGARDQRTMTRRFK